jgi:uncharacterized membrane protein YgcG
MLRQLSMQGTQCAWAPLPATHRGALMAHTPLSAAHAWQLHRGAHYGHNQGARLRARSQMCSRTLSVLIRAERAPSVPGLTAEPNFWYSVRVPVSNCTSHCLPAGTCTGRARPVCPGSSAPRAAATTARRRRRAEPPAPSPSGCSGGDGSSGSGGGGGSRGRGGGRGSTRSACNE